MKSKLLFLVALSVLCSSVSLFSFAATVSAPVKVAIKKYKSGNYTGCLQDCQNIVKRDPSNALAYYYMAMSYAQAGRKDMAIQYYGKVLSLGTNSQLVEYASTGKRCLETPDMCHLQASPVQSSDMDKFIANPSPDGLSDSVRADFERKRLQGLQNEINNGKDVDSYELNKFKDYSNQRSDADTGVEKVSKKPTNDEIVAALKVLKDAGLSPYPQSAESQQPQALVQSASAVNPYVNQSPELAQINMLMGANNSGNNNSMMNMIPLMMAQSKDGKSNYSPQLMQAVIMNSMMTDMNFNLDDNKDK